MKKHLLTALQLQLQILCDAAIREYGGIYPALVPIQNTSGLISPLVKNNYVRDQRITPKGIRAIAGNQLQDTQIILDLLQAYHAHDLWANRNGPYIHMYGEYNPYENVLGNLEDKCYNETLVWSRILIWQNTQGWCYHSGNPFTDICGTTDIKPLSETVVTTIALAYCGVLNLLWCKGNANNPEIAVLPQQRKKSVLKLTEKLTAKELLSKLDQQRNNKSLNPGPL